MKKSQAEGAWRRARTGRASSAEIIARFGNEDESVYFDNGHGSV